jgi:transcription elongation GreA/GreB family factor
MLTPPKRRFHKIPTLDDHGPIPLTPEAHARMKARLARRTRELPALAQEAAETAALGDRSDNAAYQAAKSALRRAQREIFMLEDQLKRVVEIGAGPGADGRVALGSTVIIEPIDGASDGAAHAHARRTYRIVGPFETNPSQGNISHKSPLGAALLGHAQGEIVSLKTAEGTRMYRIIAVQ